MTDLRLDRKKLLAILLASVAALLVRAWLQLRLQAGGASREFAADLAYLVVPVMLLILLSPILYEDRAFLSRQFRPSAVSRRILLCALLVGVLLRVVAWAKLVAGVSFGFVRNDNPNAVEGPLFHFECAPLGVVVLGFIVMALLVPLIEEVVHRAYVQTYVHRFGPVVAVLISAMVFAALHRPSSWLFSFIAGLAFGAQYWLTKSLWPALLSHATVNALIQVDWRCLRTQWNPPASQLPLWLPGSLSVVTLLLSLVGIIWLIKKHRGS
ncbi:MAG: CPBP family intramembrane metalloprotease [Woeseiaceae bacterium]|nr:CPBP family intramembrane metalloprotease [Woeseiaceae bacterium]